MSVYLPFISVTLFLMCFAKILSIVNCTIRSQIEANKWYRLRTSVVTPDGGGGTVKFDKSCTVYKVASDGVYHSDFTAQNGLSGGPGPNAASPSFVMTGASRADFAIKCTSGKTDIKLDNGVAAKIHADLFGTTSGAVSSGNDANDLGIPPSKPASLQVYANVMVPESNKKDIDLTGGFIGYTGSVNIEYGQTHEWVISQSGPHPFHLHLYHMLIVTPGGCGAHIEGEFYDTISSTEPWSVPCRSYPLYLNLFDFA